MNVQNHMLYFFKKKALLLNLILFIQIFLSASFYLHSYEVLFEGVESEEIISLVKSVSRLEKLKETPISSVMALKRRAKADIPVIIQALHSLSYYDARVDFSINQNSSNVLIHIDTGAIFPFAGFEIRYFQDGSECEEGSWSHLVSMDDMGVKIGAPALPESIISAEDTLLDCLNLKGFAFAKIERRDVFADRKNKNVIVLIVVELGPLTYMGTTKIFGLDRVKPKFVEKKLRWKTGDIYHPGYVEKTQEALELSGLFRSVNISIADQPVDENLMYPKISVLEAKQHSIGFGLNFTTELGPGLTAEWEDRNILGQGEKLGFSANLWENLQDVRGNYIIPDFGRQDQNLSWLLDWHQDHNKSYSEKAISLSGTIERKLNERVRISYGGMYKFLRSMRSARNGVFDLIKIPLQIRWNTTDSIFEPTKGSTFQIKSIPSLQILNPKFAYVINSFTGTHYQALTKSKKHVFAVKLMLGSIIGANKYDIPPPERFFAGSENTLRGYRFLTVSPLAGHNKPLGGRSLLVYTFELRSRFGDDFGIVFFYDIGNVYRNYFPQLGKKLLKSTGIGIRYYTPIGPLRLDIAFPLNRRKKRFRKGFIDNVVEAYFSIGQSF